MNDEGSDNQSIDEQDCQVLLERALFGSPDEEEDLFDSEEQDGISEHVWTCPTNAEDARDEISIVYHLAFLAPGHGDSLWNSSRCIAEHILNPKRRADLLGTLQPSDNEREDCVFNWPPKTCLEFGAGAALPSLALLKEGAQRVVFTDRYVNEQTFDALKLSVEKNALAWSIDDDDIRRRAIITNHTWGEEIEALSQVVDAEPCNDAHDVDLLIASDCIYNPTYHGALLQSASVLINQSTGLLIVGYSLHGNAPACHVERFFTEAKEQYGLDILRELKVEYSEGQIGIGSEDESRGNVYLKILASRDSIHFKNDIA